MDKLLSLLRNAGLLMDGSWETESMRGDGSDRRFIRFRQPGTPACLVVFPSKMSRGRAEALAGARIGRHLYKCGVPVPEIYAYDEDTGIIVFEDLGDLLLHDFVRDPSSPDSEVLGFYRQAIEVLAHMQTEAVRGFDPAWCWDSTHYDRRIMLDRESGYFMDAFCRALLGMNDFAPGIGSEFQKLADRAALEPSVYLLHRDFQSRNLMIHEGRVRVIDFQGARFGPPGYDLASLLIDPYTALPVSRQDDLLAFYLKIMAGYIPFDQAGFLDGYYYLVLQRNLQIIGAFAFLSRQRGKRFFESYLVPALSSLIKHLQRPRGAAFPCLRALAEECRLVMSAVTVHQGY